MSNLVERRNRIREAVPHLATAYGSIASFQTDMRSALEEIKIHFNPLQEGTGTPSPTNIRPLYGWSGLDIGNHQKNIFDANTVVPRNGYLLNDDGVEQTTNQSGYTKSLTPVEGGQTYTINGTIVMNGTWRLYFYNAQKEFMSRTGSIQNHQIPYTFTVPENCAYIAIQYHISAVDFSTIQVEQGTTATEYEPFNGYKNSVSWSSLGTVYGGWVNPISGEVWEEWGCVTLTGDESGIDWHDIHEYFYLPGGYSKASFQADLICSYCPAYGNTKPNISAGNDVRYFWLWPDPNASYYGNVTAFRNELRTLYQNGTPFQYSWKLTTPQLVGTISPIQLKTLVGTNNIWANANGDVDVKYWKH